MRTRVVLLTLSMFLLFSNTFGQSLKFNGTNNYVGITNNAALQLQTFTLEAWIKIEGTSTTTGTGNGGFAASTVVPIISKGNDESGVIGGGLNYFLGYRPSDMKLVADFQDNSTVSNHPVVSNGTLANCNWMHVAATYNAASSTWKLYINGTRDATVLLPGSFTPNFFSNDPASIGTTLNSTRIAQGFFNGKIDEVRIWNIARTDADILANYKSEILNGTSLVARYGFNEGSGITAINSIASASNGSLVNDPEWINGFNQATAIEFNGINNYISFDKADGTSGTEKLNTASFTLEAWIKPEGTGVTATTGTGGIVAVPIVTKGRGNAESPSNLNLNYFLGIDKNKKLVADFEDSLGSNHPVVSKTLIPDNIWTHVAASYDSASAKWKLYINGVLDTTKIIGNNIYPVRNSIERAAIGSTLTANNTPQGFFNGKIDEVRIWKVARTDADISANYRSEFSNGTGLIAKWGLNEVCGTSITNAVSGKTGTFNGTGPLWTKGFSLPPDLPSNPSPANNTSTQASNTNLCVTVSDPENDKLRVRFYGRKKPNKKFTIILLPDTQYYVAEPQGWNGGSTSIFKSETNWIINNKTQRNIVYIGQLGDCVQNGDSKEVEWKRADTAIKPFEDPNLTGLAEGIPYGVCVGNHDQTPAGSATGTTNFFNQYFGTARFSGRSYYGGHFGSNNDNFYELFSVGNKDFLVIYFEYDQSTAFSANNGPLDWGENLVKSYPNRNVIVLSHWVLSANSTASFSPQGKAIYTRFKIYPNFKLMSGGHVGDGEAFRKDTYKGKTVYTIVSNYQERANGGYGLLRIYEFNPDSNNVAVQTYTPWKDAYETDANSQFNLGVSLISNPNFVSADTFHLISEVTDVSSGSSPCITWSGLEENTDYEWYAELFDGENKIPGPTWAFTTQSSSLNTISSTNNQLSGKSVQLQPSNGFTMYPNPNSTNKLTLSFNKEIKGKVFLEIFSMMGNLLVQKTFININNSVSFEYNLPSGTYTVLVQTEKGREVRKLVIIR